MTGGGGVSNGGDPDVGRLVRARRGQIGLTQQQLAHRVEVSVATIRDLEQGRTRWPRPALVDRLATALGMPVDEVARAVGRRTRIGAPPGHASAGATRLWVSILGPLSAWRDGGPLALGEPQQRTVLGMLALSVGANLHRDSLVDALWGQDPPAKAVNLVQAYVGRLRRILDPDHSPRDASGVLVSTGTSYRLRLAADQIDLLAFRELRDRAADGRAACDTYERALNLWRGEPLADVDALRRHPAVTAAIHEWSAVVTDYVQAAAAAGTAERVLPHLWHWVAGDPLNERAHAMLMLALAGAGQQAAALGVFADIRDRLDTQLGVRPGPELADAQVRVLRQETPAVAYRPPHGGPSLAPRQLPAAVRYHVGRSEELAALDRMLDTPEQDLVAPTICALTGAAGVGKTALALHWGHRVANRFPDGQLYADLHGFDAVHPPVDPADTVRGFLDGLGVPADAVPGELPARAALYRSLLAGRQILVVLDNARDSAQVRPLLPGSAGSMVVVTSRSTLTGLVAGAGARAIDLPPVGAAEARRLLARHLGTDQTARQAEVAGEVVELCGRLPLALGIVAARAAGRPDRLAELASQLRDPGRRLDVLSVGEPAGDLRAVLRGSYRHLSDPAARLFRLLGQHPGADLSGAAAASIAGMARGDALGSLDELAGIHLLTDPAPDRYSCPDLLRRYAAELSSTVDTDDDRRAAQCRLLDHYLHTARRAALLVEPTRDPPVPAAPLTGVVTEDLRDEPAAWAWLAAQHGTLLACARLAVEERYQAPAWRIVWTVAMRSSRRPDRLAAG